MTEEEQLDSDALSTFIHGKPSDFMSCLCTMEDITEEDGNYVEYQCFPSMKWKPCLFEKSVIEQMLESQFEQYISRVKETDCQAELRRLLQNGPPIYINDPHGLPLDDEDEYVIKLWFACDNLEKSAVLKGAKVGTERQVLWDSLNEFLVKDDSEDVEDET